MVSVDSFFHPINDPPKEYTVPDHILEKPCKINIRNVSVPKQPLAGRLTEIGEQILLIGSQKAKFICTGQWDFEYTKDKKSAQSTFRPGNEKITRFNAFDYVEPITKRMPLNTKQQPKPEIDRLQRAMKDGRVTPLESQRRKDSIFGEKPSPFEVKYSPERQNLIDRMKQRRQERVSKRIMNNSVQIQSMREPNTDYKF